MVYNFGLLKSGLVNATGEGFARGALWGTGYGVIQPLVSGEEVDPMNVAKNAVIYGTASATVGAGMYGGGKLLNKVRGKYGF